MGVIDNNPPLVLIIAWRRIGGKSLSEPMLTHFTDAYICGTRALGEMRKISSLRRSIGILNKQHDLTLDCMRFGCKIVQWKKVDILQALVIFTFNNKDTKKILILSRITGITRAVLQLCWTQLGFICKYFKNESYGPNKATLQNRTFHVQWNTPWMCKIV